MEKKKNVTYGGVATKACAEIRIAFHLLQISGSSLVVQYKYTFLLHISRIIKLFVAMDGMRNFITIWESIRRIRDCTIPATQNGRYLARSVVVHPSLLEGHDLTNTTVRDRNFWESMSTSVVVAFFIAAGLALVCGSRGGYAQATSSQVHGFSNQVQLSLKPFLKVAVANISVYVFTTVVAELDGAWIIGIVSKW